MHAGPYVSGACGSARRGSERDPQPSALGRAQPVAQEHRSRRKSARLRRGQEGQRNKAASAGGHPGEDEPMDYERLPESSETFIYAAMSRLMARRLARS